MNTSVYHLTASLALDTLLWKLFLKAAVGPSKILEGDSRTLGSGVSIARQFGHSDFHPLTSLKQPS